MTTNYLEKFMEYKTDQSLNKIKLIKSLNDISFNDEFEKVNNLFKLNNLKQMISDLNNSNEMIIHLKNENKRLGDLNKNLRNLNENLKDENLFYSKVYSTHFYCHLTDN
jgi:hypothetical protein